MQADGRVVGSTVRERGDARDAKSVRTHKDAKRLEGHRVTVERSVQPDVDS